MDPSGATLLGPSLAEEANLLENACQIEGVSQIVPSGENYWASRERRSKFRRRRRHSPLPWHADDAGMSLLGVGRAGPSKARRLKIRSLTLLAWVVVVGWRDGENEKQKTDA